MISSDPFNFPTAAELLVKSRESACPLNSSASDVSQSWHEGRSVSQGGFPSHSSVTSIKTENWTNASDLQGFENRFSQSCQEAPANASGLLTAGRVASGSLSRPYTAHIGATRMATYLSGSSVQPDAMQTLYLMNPGYNGYGDSSNPGNMVLLGPNTGAVGHGSPLGNPAQTHQQQHYIGFSLPPALMQAPLSQQSHIAAMSSSNLGHQNSSSNLFTGRVGSHGYNWNGELSFIPSSDVTEDNQPLAARLNSVNAGQHPTSDMSHYGAGSLSQSSLQDQVSLIPNGVALGLNMENLQASSGAGQILSLSLSPQRPSVIQFQSLPLQHSESAVSSCQGFSNAGVENNLGKGDRFPNKCVGGGLSSFKAASRESMLGSGFQSQLNGSGSMRQVNMIGTPSMDSYGSKYLKAAQELLNEVVSVGRGLKSISSKHTKVQSWMGPGSIGDGSFGKDRNFVDNTGKDGTPMVSWTTGKDGEPTGTTAAMTTELVLDHHPENVVELTSAERHELQMKKAKLMAMLDEVDRRYKQYYHQMQIVVASFESAAGLGAASTYTALALQTISKHFRCLKDAINVQIRATRRALGEEDVQGRGETSRLRFVDQQLRQQRALQQFGMMQQHAWRPQRGLPERSVSILRAWLFEHFLHPYPKDADKLLLARQTGLTRSQVSNWFINARVRLWKPMVEEMYVEETKEGDMEGADKPIRGEGDSRSEGTGTIDGQGQNEMNTGVKQAKVSDGNTEGGSEPKNASDHASDMLPSRTFTGSSSESFLFHEKESMRQGIKKVRNGVQDSTSLFSPNSSTGVDFKTDEVQGEDVLEHDIKIRTEERHREHYNIPHSGLVQADHGGYGPFQVSGLNRFSQEGLATRYPTNSGVSLTLGLQHCEGLSLSGAQQHYSQGTGQLPPGRRQEASSDYYSMNENAAVQTSNYEAMNLQNRKRYATHLLHNDFVA